MNEKIKELRKLLNLSLVAFSKPLGCSPTHIKRMEVGTVIPGEEFISKLCEVYHISPAYFDGTVSIEELDIKDQEEEKKEIGKSEYSCAMKSHFRKSGNQMSGKWKSSHASLLA